MANKSRHVTITKWKGLNNYECNYCKFATLNRREFAQHLDVHIRAGLTQQDQPPEPEDEDYGLDVGAPTNEAGDKPKDEDPKKSKGKKAGK